jgi:hypothetical protein
MTKDERRMNRKHVLDALKSETGVDDGETAAPRIRAYRDDPKGASTVEFAFCGALTLSRWYIDPKKPNGSERRGLWQSIMKRMKKDAEDPGKWNGTTNVSQLQQIAEEA